MILVQLRIGERQMTSAALPTVWLRYIVRVAQTYQLP